MEQRIQLARHRFISGQDRHIVELSDSGEFFEIPTPAAEALIALERGDPLVEIERQLKERYPDEEIDMREFLRQLQEMGFLAEKDGESHPKLKEEEGRVSPAGKLLFNARIRPLYVVFFIANIVMFVTNPGLVPHYRVLFPFESMFINLMTAFVLSILLLIFHECGHILAVRAHGLPAKARFGHRLFFIVMETEMNDVWRLNKRDRNVAFLAGMCVDQTLLFISLIVSYFVPEFAPVSEAILGIAIFQLLMMTAFQSMIFMKTDLYYVLQNVTGCYNLMENAMEMIKGKFTTNRGLNKPVMYDGEEKIVKMYAVLVGAGLFLSAALFVAYLVPQSVYLVKITFRNMMYPSATGMVWDGLFVLGQFAIMIVLLLFSWHRKYIRKIE